jgi:hypothetical protein
MTNLSDKLLLLLGFPLEAGIPSMIPFIAFDGLVEALEGLGVECRLSSLACCVENYRLLDHGQRESFGVRDMFRVIGARITVQLFHLAHVESQGPGR